MLDQRLTQEQKQSLTTQQIQKFLLLEVPAEELLDRIREELSSNPALDVAPQENTDSIEEKESLSLENESEGKSEEERDSSLDDYSTEDDIPDYKLRLQQEREVMREEIPFVGDNGSLFDYLKSQLLTLNLTENEEAIAEYVIGNLTEEGYFKTFTWEVVNDLLLNDGLSISEEEVEKVIKEIQSLEPAGVATPNLQESLSVQLDRIIEEKKNDRLHVERCQKAKQILSKHFEELANRRYKNICQALKISEEEFSDLQHLIRSLNPRPSSGFGSSLEARVNRITPDFTVHLEDNQLLIWINDPPNIPSLRITPEYAVLSKASKGRKEKIESETEKQTRLFARRKVNEAAWFIESINRRRQTLLSVMQVIVALQEDFFRTGDIALLSPMILKDIAEKVGYDVSTISRITSRKYVQSDFGIYPLKFFFSEATNREEGEAISTRQTKAMIQEIIAQENKRKPLSDALLEKALAEKGLIVARRTIAKYREQLNIPVARLRKEL